MAPERITYVTSSDFKIEESRIFESKVTFNDGVRVADLFTFDIQQIPVPELLEVDISVMVQHEVTQAYSRIKVPCIVEHAGLIFGDYLDKGYPGGLTKPMWNALRGDFLAETHSSGRRAIARAVVAYCDGMTVHTFVGETEGQLADAPRGARQFYWDTVFVPDEAQDDAAGLTYAELVAHPRFGLEYKVTRLSQSARALLKFLEYRRKVGPAALWT